MTRRQAMLAALAGTSTYQNYVSTGELVGPFEPTYITVNYDNRTVSVPMKELMDALENKPPKPNQCPQCGTMAEPYRRLTVSMTPCEMNVTPDGLATRKCREVPYGSIKNLAECANCHNAFWQTEEEG